MCEKEIIKLTKENIGEHLSKDAMDYIPFSIDEDGNLIFQAPDYDMYPRVILAKDHLILIMDDGHSKDKYRIDYSDLSTIMEGK